MHKFYSLLAAVASLFFTIAHAQADQLPDVYTASMQKPTAAPTLLGPIATEDEFEEQRKEQQRLELENSLIRARLERELADLRAEIERMQWRKEAKALKWEIEEEDNKRKYEQELQALKYEKEKIMAKVALSQAQLAQLAEQFNLNTIELQNKSALLKVEADKIRAEIEQTRAKQERSKHADGEVIYLKDPLRPEGTLVVSDRCIDLNGVITPWLANFVTDRVQYYNNKDTDKPIFIVIESSPGGSVLAGSRILKAMENSKAPVYVVVKGFAASMAALITTLATKSYAYPNAIILHHQPWTFIIGNVRETKEQLAFLQEWWKRLGGRIAEKMGISLDKLDKQLYEKSATGDWLEFADHAKKIKWVDHIITGTQDSANRELPDPAHYTFDKYLENYYGHKASETAKGAMYLPILEPKDFYYLYNADNRYQLLATK